MFRAASRGPSGRSPLPDGATAALVLSSAAGPHPRPGAVRCRPRAALAPQAVDADHAVRDDPRPDGMRRLDLALRQRADAGRRALRVPAPGTSSGVISTPAPVRRTSGFHAFGRRSFTAWRNPAAQPVGIAGPSGPSRNTRSKSPGAPSRRRTFSSSRPMMAPGDRARLLRAPERGLLAAPDQRHPLARRGHLRADRDPGDEVVGAGKSLAPLARGRTAGMRRGHRDRRDRPGSSGRAWRR